LSFTLVAHNSTALYPAGWSMLTGLFGLHPVCRHETYPVTIFHITFYFPRWVCAVLVCRRLLISDNKVTTISVQVGFVVERVTLGHFPPPINSVCPPQYHSNLMSVYG